MTPITVTVDGRSCTGIRTGIPSRGFGAQQLAGATMHGGMLVHEDRFTLWPVERLVEHRGELYLCGPLIENARSILDLIAAIDAGTEDRQKVLSTIFETARHALPHDLSLCNAITSALGDDGSVLYLKRELAERINANLPLELRRIAQLPYRHELLHGIEAETYQLAAFAYRVLTGEAVCGETDVGEAELCHSAGTTKKPIHLHNPTVDPQSATAIDGVLTGRGSRDEEGFETLARSIVEPSDLIQVDLPEAEQQARRDAAQDTLARWTKSAQRRRFRRRYGTRILVVTVAVLLIGTIPFGILRRALTPPATAVMSPRDVVTAFFDAWNDLDHVLMEEIVARGVAKDLIREVTNIYVIERVQTAYGDRGRLLSIDEWIAAGRPDDSMPYGVDELRITPIQQNEDQARVIAEYRIWRPEASEGSTILYRTRVRDTMTLRRGRYSWEIVAIDREIIESISDPL